MQINRPFQDELSKGGRRGFQLIGPTGSAGNVAYGSLATNPFGAKVDRSPLLPQ
jgi:hypothetical protein